MSGQGRDKQTRALAVRPGYEVGYARPPAERQFKPGQSGNPRGRPKGAKNKRPAFHEERMREIILDEAYRPITVRDGDRNITVPMAQAVIRSLAVNAAKGQHRAQRLFAELLSTTERQRADLHARYLDAALDYKIAWDKELERRNALGITDLPPPLPHPDHVVIDMRKGTVRLAGLVTKAEKVEWDDILQQKASLEDCVALLRKANETEDDPEVIEDNLRFIAMGEEKLSAVRRFIPD